MNWRKYRLWWIGAPDSPWVRLKWWLTYRFIDDPRRPRMNRCWARVCDWALGFDTLGEVLENSTPNGRCRDEAARAGYCYCSRFACRERLLATGQDPEAHNPDAWIEPNRREPCDPVEEP